MLSRPCEFAVMKHTSSSSGIRRVLLHGLNLLIFVDRHREGGSLTVGSDITSWYHPDYLVCLGSEICYVPHAALITIITSVPMHFSRLNFQLGLRHRSAIETSLLRNRSLT